MVRYPDYLGVGLAPQARKRPGTSRAYARDVAGNWARARARERIEAICAESFDDRSLRLQVLAILREVIDFDAYVWLVTDPVTAVGVAPLADVPCLPELPALIAAKYATSVNRWTVLQLHGSPARTLSDAVAGDLSRSLVWRDVLCRYGIGDVASAVFADQFGCWGFLDLWRDRTGGRSSPLTPDSSPRSLRRWPPRSVSARPEPSWIRRLRTGRTSDRSS